MVLKNMMAVTRECFLLLRKERAFQTILIGLTVFILVAKLVSDWAFTNPSGVFFNMAQIAFRFTGTFIALYFGIKMLHDYRVSGSVETMLSRPVSRSAFLQGNFLALTLLLLFYGLCGGLGWLATVRLFSLGVPSEFLAWGVMMSFGEWLLMGSLAVLLATVCGFGMSLFAGCSLWLIGLLSGVLALSLDTAYGGQSSLAPLAMWIAKVWSFDRFSLMNYSRDFVLPDTGFLLSCLGYSVVGAVCFLVISHICFSHRDVIV